MVAFHEIYRNIDISKIFWALTLYQIFQHQLEVGSIKLSDYRIPFLAFSIPQHPAQQDGASVGRS